MISIPIHFACLDNFYCCSRPRVAGIRTQKMGWMKLGCQDLPMKLTDQERPGMSSFLRHTAWAHEMGGTAAN